MELAVRSIVDARRVAKIGLGDATVQKANAEAGSAHVLLLGVNVTQMFVGIVGLVVVGIRWVSHRNKEMVSVEI